MRLPVRLAGRSGLWLVPQVAARRLARQAQELAGGRLAPAPPADHPDRRADGAAHDRRRRPSRSASRAKSPASATSGPDNEAFIAAGHRGREQRRADGLHRPQPALPRRRRRPGTQARRRVLDRDAAATRSSTPCRARAWAASTSTAAGRCSSASRAGRRRSGSPCACTDIPMGSFLKPYEPIPIPLGRVGRRPRPCDPPSGRPTGRIVYTRDGVVAIGNDTDVLDRPRAGRGPSAGRLALRSSATPRARTTASGRRDPTGSTRRLPPGVEIPRTYLGDLAILYVGDRWAMAPGHRFQPADRGRGPGRAQVGRVPLSGKKSGEAPGASSFFWRARSARGSARRHRELARELRVEAGPRVASRVRERFDRVLPLPFFRLLRCAPLPSAIRIR